MIDLETFRQLKGTGRLPSPKGAALAIIRATQRENVSLADLAHLVKTDPAFVGRLLKAANSVHADARRPVVSIHDALILTGIPGVRALALGFSLLSHYSQGACRNFDYSGFWSRSLLCALALQALCRGSGMAMGEELFSIGLLAHIGELALATLFSEEYARILDLLRLDPGAKLSTLERQSFVMTHDDLSAAMLADWGLPKVYLDTLPHLEDPDQAPFPEGSRQYLLLHSLVLASHIADACLAAEPERRAQMPPLLLLGARVAIDGHDLVAICDRVAREWIEWGRLLEVGTPPPHFYDPSEAQPQDATGAEDPLRVLLVGGSRTVASVQPMLAGQGQEIFEAADVWTGFEIALYRIAQEALTNCAKYGRARTVVIELNGDAERARFQISDDGIGFDPLALSDDAASPGLGLLSMRERAEGIGGVLTLDAAPGRGTCITVDICTPTDQALVL